MGKEGASCYILRAVKITAGSRKRCTGMIAMLLYEKNAYYQIPPTRRDFQTLFYARSPDMQH
jgi:hypothetical protein